MSIAAKNSNELVVHWLDAHLENIEASYGAHAVTLYGPLFDGVDDFIRDAVEERSKREPAMKKLVVLLTTNGGLVEVVNRIVTTFRRHYDVVEFIIPNYAYSAGTVLAMSGDDIHMDYYSLLGPIDPQVQSQNGTFVPALGYLNRYDQLVEKAKQKTITAAEIQLLIYGFDQAELQKHSEARELSISLLEDWLVKYKFKNWTVTESRNLPVTEQMKTDRAKEIGMTLSDPGRWHSHGRGIPMEVLTKEINLKITDFGTDSKKSDSIRSYYSLITDYLSKNGSRGIVHIKESCTPFS